jgi:hypothetical protein
MAMNYGTSSAECHGPNLTGADLMLAQRSTTFMPRWEVPQWDAAAHRPHCEGGGIDHVNRDDLHSHRAQWSGDVSEDAERDGGIAEVGYRKKDIQKVMAGTFRG